MDLADRGEGHGTAGGLGRVAHHLRRGEGGHHGAAPAAGHDLHGQGQGEVLPQGASILADEGDAVGVGIDGEAGVAAVIPHRAAEIGQVLRHRLRLVGEAAVGLGVDEAGLDAQGVQQAGQEEGPGAVAGVDGGAQAGPPDQVGVDDLQDPFEEKPLHLVAPDPLEAPPGGAALVPSMVGRLHLAGAFGVEEDPVPADQLEAVPLGRVVAGGEDDGAVGGQLEDHQLGGGGGAGAEVEDGAAGLLQGLGGGAGEGLARGARVPGEDDPGPVRQAGGEGAGEAADRLLGERPADDAADAGGAHHEGVVPAHGAGRPAPSARCRRSGITTAESTGPRSRVPRARWSLTPTRAPLS